MNLPDTQVAFRPAFDTLPRGKLYSNPQELEADAAAFLVGKVPRDPGLHIAQWIGRGGIGSYTVRHLNGSERAGTFLHTFTHSTPLEGHTIGPEARHPTAWVLPVLEFVHHESVSLADSVAGMRDELMQMEEAEARAHLLHTRNSEAFAILYERFRYARWVDETGRTVLKMTGGDGRYGPAFIEAWCSSEVKSDIFASLLYELDDVVELHLSGHVGTLTLWKRGLQHLRVRNEGAGGRVKLSSVALLHLSELEMRRCQVEMPRFIVAPFLKSIILSECRMVQDEYRYCLAPRLVYLETKDATEASYLHYREFLMVVLKMASLRVARVANVALYGSMRIDLMAPVWDDGEFQPSRQLCNQPPLVSDGAAGQLAIETESEAVYRARLRNFGTPSRTRSTLVFEDVILPEGVREVVEDVGDMYSQMRAATLVTDPEYRKTLMLTKMVQQLNNFMRMIGAYQQRGADPEAWSQMLETTSDVPTEWFALCDRLLNPDRPTKMRVILCQLLDSCIVALAEQFEDVLNDARTAPMDHAGSVFSVDLVLRMLRRGSEEEVVKDRHAAFIEFMTMIGGSAAQRMLEVEVKPAGHRAQDEEDEEEEDVTYEASSTPLVTNVPLLVPAPAAAGDAPLLVPAPAAAGDAPLLVPAPAAAGGAPIYSTDSAELNRTQPPPGPWPARGDTFADIDTFEKYCDLTLRHLRNQVTGTLSLEGELDEQWDRTGQRQHLVALCADRRWIFIDGEPASVSDTPAGVVVVRSVLEVMVPTAQLASLLAFLRRHKVTHTVESCYVQADIVTSEYALTSKLGRPCRREDWDDTMPIQWLSACIPRGSAAEMHRTWVCGLHGTPRLRVDGYRSFELNPDYYLPTALANNAEEHGKYVYVYMLSRTVGLQLAQLIATQLR